MGRRGRGAAAAGIQDDAPQRLQAGARRSSCEKRLGDLREVLRRARGGMPSARTNLSMPRFLKPTPPLELLSGVVRIVMYAWCASHRFGATVQNRTVGGVVGGDAQQHFVCRPVARAR